MIKRFLSWLGVLPKRKSKSFSRDTEGYNTSFADGLRKMAGQSDGGNLTDKKWMEKTYAIGYGNTKIYQMHKENKFEYVTPDGRFTEDQMYIRYHQWADLKNNVQWRMDHGILRVPVEEKRSYSKGDVLPNPNAWIEEVGGLGADRSIFMHPGDQVTGIISELNNYVWPDRPFNLPDTEQPYTNDAKDILRDTLFKPEPPLFDGGSGGGAGATGDVDTPSTDSDAPSNDNDGLSSDSSTTFD